MTHAMFGTTALKTLSLMVADILVMCRGQCDYMTLFTIV